MRRFVLPLLTAETMNKHTPGPWKMNGSATVRTVVDDTLIARVDWIPGTFIAERAANTALIAAAPDLLEALQCALVDLELTAGLSTTTRGVIRHMSIAKVRDALFRASGQNSLY